jgi:hypothetical protein
LTFLPGFPYVWSTCGCSGLLTNHSHQLFSLSNHVKSVSFSTLSNHANGQSDKFGGVQTPPQSRQTPLAMLLYLTSTVAWFPAPGPQITSSFLYIPVLLSPLQNDRVSRLAERAEKPGFQQNMCDRSNLSKLHESHRSCRSTTDIYILDLSIFSQQLKHFNFSTVLRVKVSQQVGTHRLSQTVDAYSPGCSLDMYLSYTFAARSRSPSSA